jgi:two-component system KDP operon response regulator KdpE
MILAKPEWLAKDRQMLKILVVDDEPQIRKFMRISLTASGYKVVEAETGGQGAEAVRTERPDLVILDLGLPDLDGQEVISLIREHSQAPIIVLSVRANETDKVEALDRGADDYVVKPFGIGELMARVRAASRQRSGPTADRDNLRIGALTIDLSRRLVIRDGAEQRLSPKEHALLSLLARNRDKVLTHGQILRELWGPAHVHDTAYLRVYVNQLRQKLEADPGRPSLIITEPGVGYRLRSGEDR